MKLTFNSRLQGNRSMRLLKKLLRRLKHDGPLITLHVIFKFTLGINLINLYNAIIFREHKIATSCDICTPLPRSTQLPHPVGIVIGHDVNVGTNVRIQQNVTIGRREPKPSEGYPNIGDGVRIGAGSVVLGDINLARGCVVGANSVVLDNVSTDATVVGVPATESRQSENE